MTEAFYPLHTPVMASARDDNSRKETQLRGIFIELALFKKLLGIFCLSTLGSCIICILSASCDRCEVLN